MKSKPDYWYRQSAVIPFRFNAKGIEILIISTRKKKKWIFPKGIVDIGVSSRQSAVKEAFEEAGVIGKLLPQKLGNYAYKKWGGNCKVIVYALDVNQICDEWEESFRERKWINISEIENYILKVKLLKMTKKLKKIISEDAKT